MNNCKYKIFNNYSAIMPDEIIPNLYLGNTSSRHPDILSNLGIFNIVTANQEPGIPYVNNIILNWDDNEYQSIFPLIEKAYQFIDNCLTKGEKVLVHCFAGISRSATVIIYYLMKKFQMSFTDAYNYVKLKRPIVHINPGFESQLKMFNHYSYF